MLETKGGNEMKVKQNLIISIDKGEYVNHEELDSIDTILEHEGFSMRFTGEPNFKSFWDAFEKRSAFDFESDYEAIKDLLISNINNRDIDLICKDFAILKSTMLEFVEHRRIKTSALRKIINKYDYDVRVETERGLKVYDCFDTVFEMLNNHVREHCQGVTIYSLSVKSGINNAQITQFMSGLNLSVEQLSKLMKFSIEI